jgi:hypothetical protein
LMSKSMPFFSFSRVQGGSQTLWGCSFVL